MNTEIKPLVSVVLPIYNAASYLAECIDSILCQTYENFELLVIDDGSEDTGRDIVMKYKDERIRLISREHNYIASLNAGLMLSKGKYIARMDADDVMYPNRIEKQVAIMEQHSEIVVCTSYMKFYDSEQFSNTGISGFIPDIQALLLVGNLLSHPTSMLRASFIRENQCVYNPEYIYAEDYKLWTDIALLGGIFYVLPEALVYYRISSSQVSKVHASIQIEKALRIRNELLNALIILIPKNYKIKVEALYEALAEVNAAGLLDEETVFWLLYRIFSNLQFSTALSLKA